MKNLVKRLVVGGVLGLALATMAVAQRAPMSVQFEGTGRINRGGGSVELNQVRFDLRSDRTAFVTFIGAKEWMYTGRWRPSGTDNYVIDIQRAYGDWNARGDVIVGMSGSRVTNLRIENGFADGMRFNGTFTVRSFGNRPSEWGGVDLSRSTTGSGSLVEPGDRRQASFRRLNYIFTGRGRFQISSEEGGLIKGNYRRLSSNRLSLDVDEVSGSRNAFGSGIAILSSDRRSLTQVEVSGRSSRGNWSIRWNASNSGGGGWDDDDDDFGGSGSSSTIRFDVRGRGDGRFANTSWALTEANGTLSRGGSFSFDVVSYGERIPVSGRWHRRDDGTVILDIIRFQGRSARGTGTIQLRGRNEVDRISFAGSVGSSRFSFSFEVARREPR